ncbi:MAG: hypothetical protein D6797_08040, partial [Bdellovibrio sp.]
LKKRKNSLSKSHYEKISMAINKILFSQKKHQHIRRKQFRELNILNKFFKESGTLFIIVFF